MRAMEGTISRSGEGRTMLLRCEGLEPPMSQLGHLQTSPARRTKVCSTLESGHPDIRRGCRLRANKRRALEMKEAAEAALIQQLSVPHAATKAVNGFSLRYRSEATTH